MAPFTWTKEGRHWTDGWAGYPGARDRLLDAIVERRARDTVVLSGDVHCNYVCDLKRRVDDPPGAVIATELCGTSIASSGFTRERVAAALPLNPAHQVRPAGRARLRRDQGGRDAPRRDAARRQRRPRPERERPDAGALHRRGRPARRAGRL